MIDASKGYVKDGNKNRLRECDIKKIVDTFNAQLEIPKYSRLVPMDEITEKNDYNLNIPRYIDSQPPEDIQDIKAHLKGGIPNFNVEELNNYWEAFGSVKSDLFERVDNEYSRLKTDIDSIKEVISESSDFKTYKQNYNNLYKEWTNENTSKLKNIPLGTKPKEFIDNLGNNILSKYSTTKLINKYDVYQVLMEYWNETMQDDLYILAEIGYKIELQKQVTTKNKKEIVTYYCELVPQELVANRYFKEDVKFIADTENLLNEAQSSKDAIVEEHCVEDGLLDNDSYSKDGKLKKPDVVKYVKANKDNADCKEEVEILNEWLKWGEMESAYSKTLVDAKLKLYEKVLKKYSELTEDEVKTLVVEDKWLATLSDRIEQLLTDLTQKLAQRVKEIAVRYEYTVPELEAEQEELKNRVKQHLAMMGY